MATFDELILTLPEANIDGNGPTTAKFHFAGDLRVTMRIERNYLLKTDGAELQFASILLEAFDELSGSTGINVPNPGDSKHKTLAWNYGAGSAVVEIDFKGWTGSTERWGDTGDDSQLTAGDATGEDAFTQLQVLYRWLSMTEVDSLTPATIEFGEYSSGGLYGPMSVLVEQPTFDFDTNEGASTFDGNLVFVETYPIDTPIDQVFTNPY